MANNIIRRVWNQNRMVNIEDLYGAAFQAESGGHTFEISGIDDTGAAVTLSGTVSGVFRRPDNADIALTGSASDGVASVTLSEDCYAVPGRFGLTIFVTSNSQKVAVYACVGTVAVSSTGNVAGDTPASVEDLIDDINAAIADLNTAIGSIPADYSQFMAAIAPAYSSSALYAVGSYAWYNGSLYRCTTAITTAETWTAAHWTVAVIGNDVSDLKSALNVVAYDSGVTNNPKLNSVIKELYISGQSLTNVHYLSVNKSSGGYTFAFKSDTSTTLFSLLFPLSGDIRIARRGDTTALGIGVFGDLDSVTISNEYVELNENKITHVEQNPIIYDTLVNEDDADIYVPIYTKTSGYRISTQGTVTSAGSTWFYSSPIQVYKGDKVIIYCAGNSSAAPLSLTDENATTYTPCVTYSGTDPDEYTYTVEADGYVCYSANANYAYPIYIIHPGELQNETPEPTPTPESVDWNKIVGANNHNIRIPSPVVSAELDTTAWHGSGATIDEITTIWDDVNNVPVKAVKVTSTDGNGIAYCELSEAVNGSNYAFKFSVCLDPSFDSNGTLKGKSVNIVLYSGNGRTSNYRWTQTLQFQNEAQDWDDVYVRDGWWHETVIVGSFPNATIGNNFDITNITAVGIQLGHNTSVTRSAFIAEMSFVPKMQRPGIVTIIDNFDSNVPAMADYASSKGVVLNLSIIPGFYEGASGAPTCASESELERIAALGHFIWNHTWTHQVLNNLTEAQIFDQVDLAQSWMNQKGYEYSRGSDFISVPSAKFNTASCNALMKTNAKMIFHAWQKSRQVFIPYYPGIRQLQMSMLDSDTEGTDGVGTTLANVAAKAITYGGITVIGFHGTFWARDNGDSWKEYIDAIAELNTHHYTLEEIYKGMWC